MKKITILACMILLILSSYSFAYVTNPGYKLFSELVSARAEKDGKPEIVYQTDSEIVVIFGLETSLEEMRYNKLTDEVKVNKLRKFPSAPESDPANRLKDAVKTYEE